MLNSRRVSLAYKTYWLALILIAVLVGVLSTQVPALLLAVVLFCLILRVFWQSLVKRDLLNTFVWVCFGYMGFAFGGLYYSLRQNQVQQVDYLSLPFYASVPENQPYLALALLIAIIGLVAFGAGYSVVARRQTGAMASSTPQHSYSHLRLSVVVGLLTVVGLVFAYLFFQSSGGFIYLLTHIYGRALFRSTAYWQAGALLLPVANLLWFSYDYRRARKSLRYWLHTALTSLLLVSFGDRWGIVGFWLMLVTVHYYLAGHRVKAKTAILLAVVASVVAVGVGIWRASSTGGALAAVTSRGELLQVILDQVQQVFGTRNLTDIDVLSWIIGRGYEEIGLLAGKSFFDVLLAPIPRTLLPEKPVELGMVVFRAYTGTDAGGSWHPSFVGELYLNFLLPGVVLGMFLLGLASSWLEGRRRRSSHPAVVLLYAIYAVKFIILLITVDFMMAFLQAAFYVLPVIAASLYIGGVRRGLVQSMATGEEAGKGDHDAISS